MVGSEQRRFRVGPSAIVTLVLALASLPLFLLPGALLVRDLADSGFRGPGVPKRAAELHSYLTPRVEAWADNRVARGAGAVGAKQDVPTTEWPLFTAVFYLLSTAALVDEWERGGRADRDPREGALGAVRAAKDLVLDPSHHTWVRRHWGPDYMSRENVFFRSLVIAALTSYVQITGDTSSNALLREQAEGLAQDLDASALGLLDDYPGECYPLDVVAAIGFIQRADAVLSADQGAFVARSLRGFQGDLLDDLGLMPFRVELPGGRHLQESRGISNSWALVFAAELWGSELASSWYARHEAHFYQRKLGAEGFREWPASSGEPEWGFEIDAGPVFAGFGSAASAFGIAAARRNGRFDHALPLAAEAVALGWSLPGGGLLTPRLVSHQTDAPYLGEAALMYFLTVQPLEGGTVVDATGIPGAVVGALIAYLGVPAVLWALVLKLLLSPRTAWQKPPIAS